MLGKEAELIKQINSNIDQLDAIVVEGYDGVGKGRILELLSEYYEVTPYRPDYNLWQQFDHRKQDRWKVSGFFWDIYSHFYEGSKPNNIMLFDRGVISGAVYNDDISIALHYRELLRDRKVLHVLVTCEKNDYFRFMEARGVHVENIELEWIKYLEFTIRYMEALMIAGVEFLIYRNSYDESDDRNMKCKSCGHYSYGWCRHPVNNCKVNGEDKRCSLANTKEVQDIGDEVHSL